MEHTLKGHQPKGSGPRTPPPNEGSSGRGTGRYALFGGPAFYAAGGWRDLLGIFETHSEAQREGCRRIDLERHDEQIDWWQVVDLNAGKLVGASATRAHA